MTKDKRWEIEVLNHGIKIKVSSGYFSSKEVRNFIRDLINGLFEFSPTEKLCKKD